MPHKPLLELDAFNINLIAAWRRSCLDARGKSFYYAEWIIRVCLFSGHFLTLKCCCTLFVKAFVWITLEEVGVCTGLITQLCYCWMICYKGWVCFAGQTHCWKDISMHSCNLSSIFLSWHKMRSSQASYYLRCLNPTPNPYPHHLSPN